MRTIAPLAGLALVVLLMTPALAQKTTAHVGAHRAWDMREGGETIADAVEVSVPFFDTGATCDNVDDYDEVCPYTQSTSPDVVYAATPAADMSVDISLLGSTYDTKLYVYDQDLNLIACNDDYFPDYVSKLESVPLSGGMRYYVVVDGYGGDCGEYVISACENVPCISVCWSGDALEGEPPLESDYVDTFNPGCDADPPIFQHLQRPADSETLVFCGSVGYFPSGDGWARDTDWLQFTAAGNEVGILVEAPMSFPTTFEVLELDGCVNVSLDPYPLGQCSGGMLTVPTTPGQLVTLRVIATNDWVSGCGDVVDEYRLYVDGIEGPVAAEARSWSDLKALYR